MVGVIVPLSPSVGVPRLSFRSNRDLNEIMLSSRKSYRLIVFSLKSRML